MFLASKKCSAWAPSYGFSFRLDQSSLGHSQKFCTNTPALLAGRSWKAFPGYRRCLIQALYPPLLGVLTRVTLVGFWAFPVNYVSTSHPKCHPIPVVYIFPSFLILIFDVFMLIYIDFVIIFDPDYSILVHFPLLLTPLLSTTNSHPGFMSSFSCVIH